MSERRSGFSVAEFLVVVTIVAFCMMLAWPNVRKARINVHQKKAVSTLASIAAASSLYMKTHMFFPDNLSRLETYLEDEEIFGAKFGAEPFNGYFFIYNSKPPHKRFLAFAIPEEYDYSGTLSFVIGVKGEVYEAEMEDVSQKVYDFLQSNDFAKEGPIWDVDDNGKLIVGNMSETEWAKSQIEKD